MILDTPSDGRYRQTSKEINANANTSCARVLNHGSHLVREFLSDWKSSGILPKILEKSGNFDTGKVMEIWQSEN